MSAPSEQTEQGGGDARRPGWLSTIAFSIVMLAFAGLFAGLGFWQMARLDQKLELQARVAERLESEPVALPPIEEWVGFDPEIYEYRPVTVTGTYDYSGTVLSFTSLSEANGAYEGVGYWVMTPLNLTGGGTIFVNRGFVPEGVAPTYRTGGEGAEGEVTLTGIARTSEAVGAFTPGPDFGNRVDWIRNIERMAAFSPGAYVPLASVYIDLPAGAEGQLPQGGETKLEFPNRHFEYAVTWFGLCALTIVMLGFWLWRPRRV